MVRLGQVSFIIPFSFLQICFLSLKLVHLNQLEVCTNIQNKTIKNAFSDSNKK